LVAAFWDMLQFLEAHLQPDGVAIDSKYIGVQELLFTIII
jgi:hypothetical protein